MSGEMMQKTLLLAIHGRVQGVFFRDSMRHEAQRLGVTGWVRNRSDGAVEAVVQGDADAVEAIVRWVHHGPELARVDRVEVGLADGVYSGFEIRYGAA